MIAAAKTTNGLPIALDTPAIEEGGRTSNIAPARTVFSGKCHISEVLSAPCDLPPRDDEVGVFKVLEAELAR